MVRRSGSLNISPMNGAHMQLAAKTHKHAGAYTRAHSGMHSGPHTDLTGALHQTRDP